MRWVEQVGSRAALALVGTLVMMPVPMCGRILRRTRQWKYVGYHPMAVLRSFWRGIGMTLGVARFLMTRRRRFADTVASDRVPTRAERVAGK